MKSSFGKNLKVTIWGGSHEPAIGVHIEGLPIGSEIDMDALQQFMDKRAPGNSPLTTSRKEADIPVPVAGLNKKDNASNILLVSDHRVSFEIRNTDVRSDDYKSLASVPRPGHADYTARLRYGEDLNMAGGGPFSARMTAPLCIAGGIAKQLLANQKIQIEAYIQSIGGVTGDDMNTKILEAKEALDSVGGIVECVVTGLPGGIGGAMYNGIESTLSPILFGIPAVKGVEFGAGFNAAKMLGSENNDPFYYDGNMVKTRTNNCGGILGGITTGMPLVTRVAFKPTPSIGIEQESVDLDTKENTKLTITGRHDPCVVIRAVPVVEAALALGILDCMADVTELKDTSAKRDLDLNVLRSQIDHIDTQLTDLFKQRMDIALDVAKYKQANDLPVLNSTREKEVLDKVSSQIGAPYEEYAKQLFVKMFEVSKAYQEDFLDSEKEKK